MQQSEQRILRLIESGACGKYVELSTSERVAQQIITEPTIVWLTDLRHAIIVYPDLLIMNPNLDYIIPGNTINSLSIEPQIDDYEIYWDTHESDTMIFEDDQNCIYWCAFYLHNRFSNVDEMLAAHPTGVDRLVALNAWAKTLL